MRSNAGIAATMFQTLADRGINILAITTCEIKVSVLIPEEYTELAVRVLHTAYGLDAEDERMSDATTTGDIGHRPRPPQAADAARHRFPRLRGRDPRRRDELDLGAQPRLGPLQCRRASA